MQAREVRAAPDDGLGAVRGHYAAIAALVWALLTHATVAWVLTGAAFIVFVWFLGRALLDILRARQAKRRFIENGGQVMEYGLFGRPGGLSPRRVVDP